MGKILGKDSLCGKCVHLDFSEGKHCCPAFPPFPPYNGIPEKYTSGKEQHTKNEEGQFANGMVFKQKHESDAVILQKPN